MTTLTLVLRRSDAGDGGWSLHAPGSTDEEIAAGDAPVLASGTADKTAAGEWNRPSGADYRVAWSTIGQDDIPEAVAHAMDSEDGPLPDAVASAWGGC